MGKHFGNLYKMRGIITYKLSPFEQRAFAGMISHGVPNIFRRLRENVFTIGPAVLLTYLVYTSTKAEHARRQRKNPADYENDE